MGKNCVESAGVSPCGSMSVLQQRRSQHLAPSHYCNTPRRWHPVTYMCTLTSHLPQGTQRDTSLVCDSVQWPDFLPLSCLCKLLTSSAEDDWTASYLSCSLGNLKISSQNVSIWTFNASSTVRWTWRSNQLFPSQLPPLHFGKMKFSHLHQFHTWQQDGCMYDTVVFLHKPLLLKIAGLIAPRKTHTCYKNIELPCSPSRLWTTNSHWTHWM